MAANIAEYSAPIDYVFEGIVKDDGMVWNSSEAKTLTPRSENANSDWATAVSNTLRRSPLIIQVCSQDR
jgi:hypothetical protein